MLFYLQWMALAEHKFDGEIWIVMYIFEKQLKRNN